MNSDTNMNMSSNTERGQMAMMGSNVDRADMSMPPMEECKDMAAGECETIPMPMPPMEEGSECETMPMPMPPMEEGSECKDMAAGECETMPMPMPPMEEGSECEDMAAGECETMPMPMPPAECEEPECGPCDPCVCDPCACDPCCAMVKALKLPEDVRSLMKSVEEFRSIEENVEGVVEHFRGELEEEREVNRYLTSLDSTELVELRGRIQTFLESSSERVARMESQLDSVFADIKSTVQANNELISHTDSLRKYFVGLRKYDVDENVKQIRTKIESINEFLSKHNRHGKNAPVEHIQL